MRFISTNRLNRFWQNGVLPIKNTLASKLDTSKVLDSLAATTKGYALDATRGKELLDKYNAVDAKLDDTGWLPILGTNLASSAASAPTAGQPVQYRKKNGIVFVQGTIGVDMPASGSTPVVLFTLPKEFKPSQRFETFATGSVYYGAAIFLFRWWEDSGDVALNWGYTIHNAAAITGKHMDWISIDAAFPVD